MPAPLFTIIQGRGTFLIAVQACSARSGRKRNFILQFARLCYNFPHVFRQTATAVWKDEFLSVFSHRLLPPRSLSLCAIRLGNGELSPPSPSEPIERRCRRLQELLVHVWRPGLGAATEFTQRIYRSM